MFESTRLTRHDAAPHTPPKQLLSLALRLQMAWVAPFFPVPIFSRPSLIFYPHEADFRISKRNLDEYSYFLAHLKNYKINYRFNCVH